jgi:hypothetical protein
MAVAKKFCDKYARLAHSSEETALDALSPREHKQALLVRAHK